MIDRNYNEDTEKAIIGQKVKSINIKTSGNCVELILENGVIAQFQLYGDCCSKSYYTDSNQFHELIGTTIRNVELCEGGRYRYTNGEDEWDVVSVKPYFLVFETDNGHLTIDWRNDSNGYYDGQLYLNVEDPKKEN